MSKQQWDQESDSPQMTASQALNRNPADPSMQAAGPLPTPFHQKAPVQPLSQEDFTFSARLHSTSLPPLGARPPMIRRASRFDPMETTPEEDGYDPTPRHPLRRIREDPQPPPPPERQERSDSVSLPGIKALLNAADQPPLVSPFGGSFFQSPSIKSAQSSTSPLDSPTSRTSRFSSLTSSAADSQGWWAPDERSSVSGFSRSSSFSARGGEPDYKRRRSDLAPIPADADETARLKWQAQSRNASFPVTLSGGATGGNSGGGLRSMLYPPPASSSHLMRGSISGTPLASPMSPDSPFDYHASSRSSPMTGPLARSFADLAASEHSPPSEAPTPLRARSPTDRRPSMFPRHTLSSESVTQLSNRETPPAVLAPSSYPAGEPGQRLSLTRPPSPEPAAPEPRRSSLAELIMAKSGDNVTMAPGGRFFHPLSSDSHPNDRDVPYIGRRESTESIMSNISASFVNHLSSESDSVAPARDRRAALVAPPLPASGTRRPSFCPVSEDEPESQGDPGMRGMEVLAESARRVADAERRDSVEEDQPSGNSPAKPSGGSTGPKYPCQYCKKAFTRPSSLRIHTYSHTGERPYVCSDPTCRRRFSVQSNLKRHAKVHHQNNQQAQNASPMGNHHPRQQPPPGPHPMHMGRGPQPNSMYGYPGPPHPGHGPPMPPHPHMVHPSHHPPPGYGPPPPGYMPGPPVHPGPPPGHYRGPMRPDHGPPYHVDQRRLSHDLQARGHPQQQQLQQQQQQQLQQQQQQQQQQQAGGDGEWETDEEEDELDDDV